MKYHQTILLLVLLLSMLAAPAYAQAPEPPPTPLPIPDPDSDPEPGITDSDYWVGASMDRMWYDLTRRATGAVWVGNKLMFTAADTLSVFRVTMTNVFDNVLDVLGVSLLDVALAIVVPGMILALILMLVSSFVRVSFASVRRGIVLLVAIPAIFGSIGVLYSTLEGMRLDLSNGLSGAVYDATTIEISGNDVADLAVYNPDAPNRLVDVAAAMIFVRLPDVQTREWRMPVAFEAAFYTPAPSNWSTIGWQTREAYNAQATAALVRMSFGLVPCTLMLIDAAIQFGWTAVLGVLFACLTVVLCFAVFTPFAASASKLVTLIFNVLVTSAAISVVQGLLVALLVWVTSTGNPDLILIASIAIVALYLSFLFVVAFFAVRALMNVGAAPVADDAVGERALQQAGGMLLGGIAGGVAGSLSAIRWADRQHPSGHAVVDGARTFIRDKRFGESNAHALGYALGPSAAGQRIAKAGLLTGFVDVDGDFNRGVYDAAIVDRGKVNSYKAVNRQAWDALPPDDDEDEENTQGAN